MFSKKFASCSVPYFNYMIPSLYYEYQHDASKKEKEKKEISITDFLNQQ